MASNREESDSRDSTLMDILARAYHLLSEGLHEQVKWHGLSVTEWRVLAALAGRDGIAMTELADIVLFKQPTLTKAIDRMEQTQLVQRRTPSEDRRRTLVYLTERGRRMSAPLVQRARQYDVAVNRALGDTASRELKTALVSLIERVGQLPREQRPRRALRASSAAHGD